MSLCVLLHAERAETRERAQSALLASAAVERVELASGAADLLDRLRAGRFDAVFVDLEGKAVELLALLEAAGEDLPPLLLGGSRDDAEILVRALRLRPETFVVDQAYDELEPVLQRIVRERPGKSHANGVIALTGSKGGVGTTLLTCELASALTRVGASVAVLDLCPQGGDVSLHLDLLPTFSLADVARKGEQLDDEYLRTVSARDSRGVAVLASPPHFEDAGLLSPRQLERTIRLLRREYDWILLDVSREWGDVSLKAIDLADLVLVVATPEVPALTHARNRQRLLIGLGAPEDRVRVLINRSDSGTLDTSDCAKALGFEPDATLPSDYRVSAASVNEGRRFVEIDGGGRLDCAVQDLVLKIYDWFELGPVEFEGKRSLVARIGELLRKRGGEKGVQSGAAQ